MVGVQVGTAAVGEISSTRKTGNRKKDLRIRLVFRQMVCIKDMGAKIWTQQINSCTIICVFDILTEFAESDQEMPKNDCRSEQKKVTNKKIANKHQIT